ncbi:hypothetical protein A6A07_15875 [Streptomyces sp. CB03911]|nr:hypothetical protein A6A07_15875 [Streptomyces sp. CB03911]
MSTPASTDFSAPAVEVFSGSYRAGSAAPQADGGRQPGLCQGAAELRRNVAADQAEQAAPPRIAQDCTETEVAHGTAP